MSLSSTSTTSGRGTTRVVTAVAVAVAVLAPLAVLCAQVWSSTGSARSFTADERRGVAYLEPLTQLLSATTEAQSAAVRGKPVDAARSGPRSPRSTGRPAGSAGRCERRTGGRSPGRPCSSGCP